MRAQDLTKEIDEAEGRSIAAASMSVPEDAVTLAASTGQMRVFQGTVTERKWRFFSKVRRPVRAIDREGVIRVQRSNATVNMAPAGQGLAAIRTLRRLIMDPSDAAFWQVPLDAVDTPASGNAPVDVEQAIAVAKGEFAGLPPDAPIALIAVEGARGIS
jgi:hypothetical protein